MSPRRRSLVLGVLLFAVFSTLEGSLETWGSWGSCSKTCGSGSQSRSRACNSTTPLIGGTNCSVTLSETQSCNVQNCSSCSGNVQADIVFVMDASSSVVDVEFEKMKEFVRDQVDVFDIGYNKIRVGMLKFSSSANTEFNLNAFNDKDAMKNRIMNISYTGGTTNTGDALRYMRSTMFTNANGDRNGVYNFGVILTARKSDGPTYTADQAIAAQIANITIFSIGIGSDIVVNELSDMASNPDSDYLFSVASFSSLSGIHTAFQAKACVPAAPVFTNCGGHLSGQGGQIVSPNFPDHYPNNSVCTWTLTGLPGDQIRVAFSHLDLENSSDCHRDSLRFRNGAGGTASLLSRVCSDVLPSDIISTGKVMYVRFVTDFGNTRTGFNFTWTSGCAQTYTAFSASQTLSSLDSRQECTFIIRQLQSDAIRLQFYDFHLGNDNNNCTNNYVEVHDGGREGSTLLYERYCGTINPPWLTSSQNMMWIRYVTDGSDLVAGFRAKYSRTEACTVVLTERNGTFTSPSYPANYRNDMYCTWKITTETDNVIRLTFNNFSLESATTCRYDWVDILDGATLRGRYCGESPGTVTSSSNRVTVTFKTDGSVTTQGFSASYVTYPSSVEASLATWGSWGSCTKTCGSGSQSRSRACNNTAPSGTGGTNCSVTLSETQSCNVHACSSCSGNVQADLVFVMDASGSVSANNFQTMKEFVRDEVDAFDIGGNKIRVGVLRFSTSVNTEFNLNDFYDKDTMKKEIMNINYTGGGTYTGDALRYMRTTMFTTANGDREGVNNIGVILTDGQSNNFDHTADQARAARNANITIFSIGISSGSAMGELSEMASNPDSDYLFSVSSFSALSGIHTAFQAQACVPAAPVFNNCGGQLSGQGGQIVSPNFPDHYPNNSLCVWTLTGPPGDKIRVAFSHLDLENSPDCHRDSLTFRNGADGTASLLSRVCSDVLPSDITSTGNVMYVRFVTELWNTGTGFNITWTSVCTAMYTSPRGYIQTSGVNRSQECTFIIQQLHYLVIHLEFQAVHLGNDTTNCTNNYVEVRDGGREGFPLLGERYCGTINPPLLTSSQNMMWIRYVTDGSDLDTGFRALYTEACPTVVLTERNGTFTSPYFPANYPHGMNCTWQITVETEIVIRLTFTYFSLESATTCSYDWVDILDGATLLGRYCGESGPGTVTSSSNRVTVTFKTDGSVSKQGFSASYVTYSSSVFNNCGGHLSGQGGQIVSPNFPGLYPNNSICAWTITGLPGDKIRVAFSHLDLENSSDCHRDSLSFRNGAGGTASLLSRVCSDVLSSDITSTGNVMYVRFVTDLGSSGTGFNITWTSVCTKTYLLWSGAIQTPRVNSSHECTFIIRQPQSYVIYLQFHNFHVGNDTVNCTTNYVEVRDGDDEGSPLLGQRYCRSDNPPLLTSSQNMTWIRYVTDGSDNAAGLNATYWRAEPCPTVVLTERNGTFTSPSYPSNYRNYMYCTWKITAETNNAIRLTFTNFSLESHPDCRFDWVDILDGATPLGRYCGNSGPGTVTSSSNRVTVSFNTDYSVTTRGFSASYVIFPSSGYPPECSSTQNNVSFPDSAAVGTCSTVTVQCSTSGPDTTLDVTNSTDGPVRWTISQGNMDTDSSLVFTVCVTDVLYHFIGQYEAILNVSNSTGVTSVMWSMTIDDVNQPPAFLSTNYNIQVSESTTLHATIAQVVLLTSHASENKSRNDVITVWDPDNVTDGFEFRGINVKSVNVTYSNASQVTTTDQSSLPIYLRNDSGPPFSFLTRIPLAAGVQLAFTLQAEDEQGLVGSNTVVTFVVSDVNQAPVCSSDNVNLTIGLTKQVNDSIYTLSCADFDVNSTLSSLTYQEYTTSDSDHFSISHRGEISLEQRLPLNVTTMTYTVYVMDGGGLVANVTLHLDINRNFPPTCPFPSRNHMTLPETANATQCDTLTIACSHRTELDHYGLTFNVAFVYDASLFQVDHQKRVQPPSYFNVTGCPNTDLLGHAGSYNLGFTVSSELGTYSNTLGIVVTDVNQPPQFDQDSYMFNVSEYSSSGATVAHVVVGSSSAVAGRNEIRATDPDKDSRYILDTVRATGSSVFHENGTQVATVQKKNIIYNSISVDFTVTGALTPEQYYVFLLTATDKSNLSASATVSISIYDVNEPPSCPSYFETRANMTLPIGSSIFNVNCTDNDVKADYRNVSYGDYQTNDFGYFYVSTTGDVTLASDFPTDVSRLQYDVFARDGGGLTTNVTLFVAIKSHFGPECTPSSQIDVSFPEDALSGTCSQTLVTCTDTSGRSLPMTVRVISDATQGEIRVNGSRGVNSSTVDMKACVAPRNSSLMTFGQFEITVEVNNTLNVTQVTFNVTVTDVNQPPFFSQSANLTTVPEFVSGSSTTVAVVRSPSDRPPSNPDVVDIVRDDPDTQENFDIVSIQYALRAEYTNRTTYEGDYNTTGSIIMVGNSVVRNYSLRPDLVYFVDLTVKDGQGLSGNTTLEVKVTDVNEPPSCQLKPNKTLDILESVQTIVASVSCMDSDYNDTYRDLSYFSYQEADHVYFDVETSGDVKLVTSVPRDAIQLVLKAYAIDGGGLEDNTTLTFIIDRNHPPNCLPSYLPPDGVWEYDKCFRVYPNCSDPTTPDGDKRFLNYTFTGSWQNGFRQTVQVNDTYDYAEFCYTLRSDGNFTIHLVSSNGLSNHTWDQDVIVSYKVASPKFTSNRYNAVPVNETAAVGFLVETIQALVDGQSVPLVYSFTGAGMFEQFFTIDSNTGNITVLKDLSPLAETEQKTYVMATDPATNLTHSVPVAVNVNDVNQPPICSPTELDVTVLWNVTITDVITRVNCTDLDARDDFSQLFYNLATPTSNMWRSEQSAVKLVSRARLDPMTSQYIVNVLVNDTTFTATTTVTINIDRTPPKPLPSVSSVTTDTANIAWTLDQLYLPVITNFTIAIRKSSNTKPRIFVVGKNSLFYVITDLTPEQTYRVDVTVNGFAANVTSDEVTFTTQPLPILAQVSAEIKLTNKTWSRDLLDNTSVAFTDLQYKIESDVHNRLGSVLGYVSTKVRSFRAGSVYADIAVTSNQSLSDTGDLKTVLSSLVSNGSVGSLPVNSSYLQFYNGAYYIADMSLDYTSKGKVSNSSPGVHVIVTGYDVTATCSSRTPGVSQPKFDWTLGGQDVTSMQSSGRYNISFKNYSDTDPYKFVSSVTIKNILTTDSGQLVCNVTAAGNTITKQVMLQVVKRLETILFPPTSIVSRGSDVNLVCARRAGYDVPWRATLYPVGNARGQVKVANKNKNDKQANFTIRGVSSKVRYRCNISDIIATAVSNESTIFIKATRNCSKDEDWAETPGGNTIHLRCPQRYADGYQYRTCSTDGQWSEPDTSRCVRQELKDLKTTIDKIANRTTNETTKDVVKTLQNTTVDSKLLLGGDVAAAVDILDKVANFTVNTKQAPGEDELKKFVMVADNVLHAPSDVWRNQPRKAFSLVNAVDKMGTAASRTLNSSGSQRPPIISKKIVLQVGRSNRNDIVFPIPSQRDSYPQWVTEANNSAFLSKDAFNESLGEIKYSAVIYGNLSNVFSGQLDQTGASELLIINSPILALSLALDDVTTIQSPVRLTFDHIKKKFSNASCRFLDFSASATGIWSTKGCWVTTSNSNMTVCECDHLTNFAVLMSPYRPVNEVADVLNVFSIVGCSISIFCLILTLVIYFILWRYVKSDRSVLLVHLCVVLVLAYVTFLAGVNRVENENVCTVVAGLLHYLWLVVFFLMLCEGIDIFITVVIVFPIKSVVPWLLLMAYGMPVIIVGVSMGVTKSEGYGGKVFCWLSLEEGLFWAFVGPAVAALLTNFVFIVIVIHTLLNSRVMITKDKRERAKSVVKAICVMTPILGLSWIFGVLSVNEETVVFQILFVIFNSLQGLMIFILHCVLSKQVKEGMQHKQRRYQANSKAAEDSSSKYVSQKPTSESSMSSNDLNKKTISPFLQVDQLSQQLASKLNKLDNSNLMSSHVTPKVMALKNPVAGITCTPQAKERSLNIPLNNTIDGQDDQHRRLDHVYGAGTRKSDNKMMGVAYPRSRGGRFSLSAPNIGISPPLGNPVYHDAVPALSPTDRWVRGAKSSRPQQQQRRGQQHPPVRHLPQSAAFEQPHSSFYRLGASADNLGSAHYQHFATQGQVHNRHGNKRQPNQVDAKPSMLYHEPPVDYQ